MSRFIIIASIIVVVNSLFCCSSKTEKESESQNLPKSIEGEWKAQWEMTGEDVMEFPPKQRKMAGKMSFNENGEVKVTTYGFEGCIFMPDTSTNTMNYKIENQVLRFMDKKDVHGIPYNIESFKSNEIRLSIMENIHLTLKR